MIAPTAPSLAPPIKPVTSTTQPSRQNLPARNQLITDQRSSQFIVITPEGAKDLLTRNEDNRRLRKWWVAALANKIRRGEWIATHQGIALAKSGRLLDGQHRLAAIAESGQAVEILLVTGISDEAFKVIDSGVKRSIGDLTGLKQKEAEVARVAAVLATGEPAPSSQIILQIYDAGLGEVLQKLSLRATLYFSGRFSILAACVLLLDGVDEQYVVKSFNSLLHLHFDDMQPIHKLLYKQVASKRVRAQDETDTLARMMKALDPKSANLALLRVSDEEAVAYRKRAKAVLSHLL